MPEIRLIAVDMDGTLLNSRKELPEDFVPWVLAHPRQRVAIASGRQYYNLLELFGEAASRLLYIAENGGLVFDGGELIYRAPLAPQDVTAALPAIEALPGVTTVLCGVRAAYMRPSTPALESRVGMFFRRLEFAEDLAACAEQDEIVKLSLYVPGRAARTFELLSGLPPRLLPVVSGTDWIDIAGAGVNKGAALRAVQARLGISPEETMGFGDYMNDYELLQACGESYAMANACPEILAVAGRRTAGNDEDGVMRVLRTLG